MEKEVKIRVIVEPTLDGSDTWYGLFSGDTLLFEGTFEQDEGLPVVEWIKSLID